MNGHAFARGQIELRLCSITVPVRDAGGKHVAGIELLLHGRMVSAPEAWSQFFQRRHQAALARGNSLRL